jgi:hypothetical protein
VELQISGAPAQLLSAQDAMALAELLRRAAIVPGPGQDEPVQPVFDVLDDDASVSRSPGVADLSQVVARSG